MGPFLRVFILPLLIAGAWCSGLVWYAGRMPVMPNQEVRHADAIVVLTGGRARLENGLQRLLMGNAPLLFVSGVSPQVTEPDLLRTVSPELAERVRPIASDRIMLGHHATSTIGNALETSTWLKMKSFNTILLVTASYHMPRAVEEFQALMPNVTILPDPVFPDDFDRFHWWVNPTSLRFVVVEFHKYLGSKLRRALLSGNKSE